MHVTLKRQDSSPRRARASSCLTLFLSNFQFLKVRIERKERGRSKSDETVHRTEISTGKSWAGTMEVLPVTPQGIDIKVGTFKQADQLGYRSTVTQWKM